MRKTMNLDRWRQFIKNRRDSLIRSSLIIKGFDENQNILDFNSDFKSVATVQNNKISFYVDKSTLAKLVNTSTNKLTGNYFKKLKNVYQILSTQLEKESFNLPQSSQNLKTLDNRTLLKTMQNFFQTYKKFAVFMIIPHILQISLTSRLQSIFKSKGLNPDKILLQVSIPIRETFEEKFQHQLLLLATSRKEGKRITEKLNVFANQWGFYSIDNYAYLEKFNYQKVKKIIGEILKSHHDPKIDLSKMEKEKKKREQAYFNLCKKVNFSNDEKNLLSFLQYLIWLRTQRLMFFRKAHFYSLPLILETLRRMRIKKEDITVITFEELERFLTTGQTISTKELLRRQKASILSYHQGKLEILSGPHRLRLWNQFFTKKTSIQPLKGWPANRGKVKGQVRIITNRKDISKFKKGEILVTNMTNPDYVIIMGKAAAIVTDEGGITCHAAIVSRELGVPCIVGTQVATEILKDGDFVEVDAEKGIVKKITPRAG